MLQVVNLKGLLPFVVAAAAAVATTTTTTTTATPLRILVSKCRTRSVN
jgi:hypothetical protein